MTAESSAVMRLRRAIINPRVSGRQIRMIAAELPQVGLADALAILLALLDREPAYFDRGGARWAARLTLEHRLTLAEAQLALASVAALPGPGAPAAIDALVELAERCRLRDVDRVIETWLATRPDSP